MEEEDIESKYGAGEPQDAEDKKPEVVCQW